MEVDNLINQLRNAIRLEEKEQEIRLQKGADFKLLKSGGLLIYPIQIIRKSYHFDDNPLIKVEWNSNQTIDTSIFNEGTPVLVFSPESEAKCSGQLQNMSQQSAEIILFTDDVPDWIEEEKIGIKKMPDSKTFQQMHGVLNRIEKKEDKMTYRHFEFIHQLREQPENEMVALDVPPDNSRNEAQNNAVRNALTEVPIQIVHGPPGTGKTTTLVHIIKALRRQKKTIVAGAPSNAAVDHLAMQLLKTGLKVMRLGNSSKISEQIWKNTPEGILNQDEHRKQLKALRIQFIALRKQAQQYKRKFGSEERIERKRLYNEAKEIRKEINRLVSHFLSSYMEKVDVVLGTPVGLTNSLLKDKKFDVAIIDEAAQCIEPLSWLIAEKGKRIIFAGDHHQLPPTVMSKEAQKSGLSISLLERAIAAKLPTTLLEFQYRMTPEIASFSSNYFYQSQLKTNLVSIANSVVFYDTAGADFNEERETYQSSICNKDEAEFIANNHLKWEQSHSSIVLISPYSQQVELLKEMLPERKCSTIDSFQGQESECVIISLVRSNKEGNIGFLSDYRRMNVALTRAKKQLIIVGDSTTLSHDPFYQKLLSHIEELNGYRSVFELIYT